MEILSPTVPVRIAFAVTDLAEGRRILENLVEERLISGGTVLHAESLNWVGGKITEKWRLELTAYTTFSMLPIITERLRTLCKEPPTISRYVMAGEKEEVLGWVERNVRR